MRAIEADTPAEQVLDQLGTSMLYTLEEVGAFLGTYEVRMVLVGALIAAMCSLLSTYVVLRRMALIAEGVSHAGFGGFAFAIFLGYFFPALDGLPLFQYLIAGGFCLLTALLIGYFSYTKKVSEDSAIGIFLVASLAVGMMLLNWRAKQSGGMMLSIDQLLFGNITSVMRADLLGAALAAVFCFGAVAAFYNELLYTTLDEEMARINGVRTGLINVLLFVMISLVIVLGIRMVGALLITALTVLPGATAQMISRRFRGVMLVSLLIGVLGTVAAIVLAITVNWFGNLPTGPIIVLVLFIVFLVTWAFRHLVKPRVVEAGEDAPAARAAEKSGDVRS